MTSTIEADPRPRLLVEGELVAWIKAHVGLTDAELGELVARSAQTVKRWRKQGAVANVPPEAYSALDDVRAIVSRLVEAGFDKRTIRGFLRSRNVGLGNDRPLTGLSVKYQEFRRVAYVTDCFIAGFAPKAGARLVEPSGAELQNNGDHSDVGAPTPGGSRTVGSPS